MNLQRARRAINAGMIACPLTCLMLAAATWETPARTVEIIIPLAAAAAAGGMWLLLHVTARWLDAAATERSDLGNQLIQSQKMLALGEISTGIAHEINNPLNIIMQEAELMRVTLDAPTTPENAAEIRGSLDVIRQQVERCSDITHKLLDFARTRRTVSQSSDINRLVEDMLSLVERETGPRNIRIVTTLNPHLPPAMTDPPLLRQVILNLLINAVQAVDRDGRIDVATYWKAGLVCTEIHDSGPGIPAANLERIFNPFFTTKPPGKGTGLGLSVSLRIVNQLGGDIMVRSEPGKGAAFTVCIPSR